MSEYGFYNKFWNVSWQCTHKPEIQLHMRQEVIGHFGPTLKCQGATSGKFWNVGSINANLKFTGAKGKMWLATLVHWLSRFLSGFNFCNILLFLCNIVGKSFQLVQCEELNRWSLHVRCNNSKRFQIQSYKYQLTFTLRQAWCLSSLRQQHCKEVFAWLVRSLQELDGICSCKFLLRTTMYCASSNECSFSPSIKSSWL